MKWINYVKTQGYFLLILLMKFIQICYASLTQNGLLMYTPSALA